MAKTSSPSTKHPAMVLHVGLLLFSLLFGALIYKKYFKSYGETPKGVVAEFPIPAGTCENAKNLFFAPRAGIIRINTPLAVECWTGWVTTPPDWEKWELQWTGPGGIWIQFSNSDPEWLPADSHQPFGTRRGIVRASGKGTFFVRLTS